MGIRVKEKGDVYKMTHMDCYGRCNEKQILCQMCKRIEDNMFNSCKSKTQFETDLFLKIKNIMINCQHHSTAWDETIEFDCCHKNGNGYGRHADECNPSLECEQYKKKED